MTIDKKSLPAFGIVAAGLIVLFIVVNLYRPLMPVDETRYMSVAWEMLQRHNFLLPTLNFEPYPHKPPMLFWLINLMWSIFGVNVWPARILSFGFMAAFLLLTRKLLATLAQGRTDDPVRTGTQGMLMVAALPLYLVYGSTIMFDTMMGIWVLCAMMLAWAIAQGGNWKLWFAVGAVIGMGIVAKGPVALVYMLPVALSVKYWHGEVPAGWFKGLAMAVLTGAMIGLAWAVPAALSGGEAYAEKIFVTQSAGRMVNAFDHRRPFWFYIPVLVGFILPLLLLPGLPGSIRDGLKDFRKKEALRFALSQVVPAFLIFSLIQSKQMHYMIPLLPGCVTVTALCMTERGIKNIVLPAALMLLVPASLAIAAFAHHPLMGIDPAQDTVVFGLAATASGMALIAWSLRSAMQDRALLALAVVSFLMITGIHAELGTTYLPKYDMRPLKMAIEPYMARPMAAAPKYDGEYGFLIRAHKTITSIGRENMDDWFKANPDGIVLLRYKNPAQVAPYHVLYTQNFRPEEKLSLIEKR